MNRRSLFWLMAVAMLTLLAVVAAPAFPLEQEPQREGVENAQPDDSAVEEILRQQEKLITGERFSYDSGGRPDPFRSPFENLPFSKGGKRPPGAAGMLVAEIDVSGVVQDERGGNMAVVMGSDNKGYFMRVGDAVYDGTVIAIDPARGTITFRQQVDDPRVIKPYRDIVKRLVPQEDEESADD